MAWGIKDMGQKCYCKECNWQGTYDDALHAPNPFSPEETLIGCPDCKAAEEMEMACYETGCWEKASCGSVRQSGYQWSCFSHSAMAQGVGPRRGNGTS